MPKNAQFHHIYHNIIFFLGQCSSYDDGRGAGVRDPAVHNWEAIV